MLSDREGGGRTKIPVKNQLGSGCTPAPWVRFQTFMFSNQFSLCRVILNTKPLAWHFELTATIFNSFRSTSVRDKILPTPFWLAPDIKAGLSGRTTGPAQPSLLWSHLAIVTHMCYAQLLVSLSAAMLPQTSPWRGEMPFPSTSLGLLEFPISW